MITRSYKMNVFLNQPHHTKLACNSIFNGDYQKYFYFSLMYIVSHILRLSLKITSIDKQQVSSLN